MHSICIKMLLKAPLGCVQVARQERPQLSHVLLI